MTIELCAPKAPKFASDENVPERKVFKTLNMENDKIDTCIILLRPIEIV